MSCSVKWTNNKKKCEFELCPRANLSAVDFLVNSDEDNVENVVGNARWVLENLKELTF